MPPRKTTHPGLLVTLVVALALTCVGQRNAPDFTVIQVTVGTSHTCALSRDGTVWCWGDNSHGQLGDGTRTDRSTPTRVLDLSSAVEITAGGGHTCARLSDRSLACWGDNRLGQLGAAVSPQSDRPVRVPGLDDCAQVVTGDDHTCALTTQGAVRCWGANGSGQAGQGGDATEVVRPRANVRVVNVRSIAAGGQLSCALHTNGAVSCWGHFGSVGAMPVFVSSDPRNPDAVDARTSPTLLRDIANVQQVVVDTNACFLINGSALCRRSYDPRNQSPSMVQPGTNRLERYGCTLARGRVDCRAEALPTAQGLSVGPNHACVWTATAEVHCWGNNDSGQLGRGTVAAPWEGRFVFRNAQVCSGPSHACVRMSDRTVQCWGDNFNGQLGDGSRGSHYSPSAIRDLAGVAEVRCGTGSTCARLESGAIRCWGAGQGVGGRDALLPTTVEASVFMNLPVASDTDGGFASCSTANGSTTCTSPRGPQILSSMPTSGSFGEVPGVTGRMIGRVGSRVCVLGSSFHCWGDQEAPRTTDATNVRWFVGRGPACRMLTSGSVECTYEDDRPWTVVPGVRNVQAFALTSNREACAIDETMSLKCWRIDNPEHVLTHTPTGGLRPVDLAGLESPERIAALTADGSVRRVEFGSGLSSDSFSYLSGIQRLLPTDGKQLCGATSAGVVRCVDMEFDAFLRMQKGWIPTGTFGDCALDTGRGIHCLRPPPLLTESGNGIWPSSLDGSFYGPILEAIESIEANPIDNGFPAFVDVGRPSICIISPRGRVLCAGAHYLGSRVDSSIFSTSLERHSRTEGTFGGRVVAGPGFYCVSGAGYECRGFNTYSQLGNGSSVHTRRFTPLRTDGASIESLFAGYTHMCGLGSGQIHCWGSNYSGELGTAIPHGDVTPLPVRVDLSIVPTSLALGLGFSCAILSDQGVSCWGNNRWGQLGDGGRESRATARRIPSLDQVQQLSAGQTHVCALRGDGSVWCWGQNTAWRPGHDSSPVNVTPVRVQLPEPATLVQAAVERSCALLRSGRVFCWGRTPEDQRVTGARALAVADSYACVLESRGLYCWGNQFGEGMVVEGGSQLTTIAARGDYLVTLSSAGDILVAGSRECNEFGCRPAGYTSLPIEAPASVRWR